MNIFQKKAQRGIQWSSFRKFPDNLSVSRLSNLEAQVAIGVELVGH